RRVRGDRARLGGRRLGHRTRTRRSARVTRAAVACALGLLVAWAALAAPEAVTILRDAYGVPHQPGHHRDNSADRSELRDHVGGEALHGGGVGEATEEVGDAELFHSL